MTVDHLAIAACKDWHFEAELADAAAHSIHCGVVFPRVASVQNELVNRPDLDF
jgi:hypothetical protein